MTLGQFSSRKQSYRGQLEERKGKLYLGSYICVFQLGRVFLDLGTRKTTALPTNQWICPSNFHVPGPSKGSPYYLEMSIGHPLDAGMCVCFPCPALHDPGKAEKSNYSRQSAGGARPRARVLRAGLKTNRQVSIERGDSNRVGLGNNVERTVLFPFNQKGSDCSHEVV